MVTGEGGISLMSCKIPDFPVSYKGPLSAPDFSNQHGYTGSQSHRKKRHHRTSSAPAFIPCLPRTKPHPQSIKHKSQMSRPSECIQRQIHSPVLACHAINSSDYL